MNKAIFLDKDGTLIEDVPYNVDPELIKFTYGALEGLSMLNELGYVFIIISNQSGVARGYFKEEALTDVRNKIELMLQEGNVQLKDFYYCPHYYNPDIKEYANPCSCRKPEPGLLLKAAQEHGIDLTQSWMIGDILNDVEAGKKAGCKAILISKSESEGAFEHSDSTPDYVAGNLAEAARHIAEKLV
jgi:D-glycero-D-manno-heptose 1,7-bisphosphate phosphatase